LKLLARRLTRQQIIELLGGISKIVKERETGTLRYQLHRQTSGDPPTLVVIEKYLLQRPKLCSNSVG
jgi:quinol monooxygenase YgiN